MRTAGSPLLRHQPSDPGYIEACLGLIVGQPRDPVFLGCMGHRRILDRHAAQHLVLDLHDIARVDPQASEPDGGWGSVAGSRGPDVAASRRAETNLARENKNAGAPLDYLTALQRRTEELAASPAEWMPWNYRPTPEQSLSNH